MSGASGSCGDHLDGAAGGLDRGDDREPLLARADRVGLVVEVHEGVDRVVDAEVVRLGHQVVVAPRELRAHVPSSDEIVGQSRQSQCAARVVPERKRLSDNRGVMNDTPVSDRLRPRPQPGAGLDGRPGGRGAAPLAVRGRAQPGTPLREVALAEALGVSRSTVREALGDAGGRGPGRPGAQQGHPGAPPRPRAGPRRLPGPGGDRDGRRPPLGRGRPSRARRAYAGAARRTPSCAAATAPPRSSPPPTSTSTAPWPRSPGPRGWSPSRVAARRGAARARPGRPGPRQRRRAGALPRHLLDLLETGDLDAAAEELTAHLAGGGGLDDRGGRRREA